MAYAADIDPFHGDKTGKIGYFHHPPPDRKNYVFWNMTRYLLTALILGLRLTGALAQQLVHYVELTPPKHKVSGSLYNHIEFMDSRPDTFLIGPIQIGPFGNIDARLVFKDPTQPRLEQFIAGFVDSTAQDGTLLLQLRDLSYVEPIKVRYLYIKATLYARTNNGYRKLSTLDVTDVLDGSGLALAVNSIINNQWLDLFRIYRRYGIERNKNKAERALCSSL